MKLPNSKYNLNQKVYVYSKDGLVLSEIKSIHYIHDDDGGRFRYHVGHLYGESYSESQIVPDYKAAKKQLETNLSQLVLMLE